MEDVLKFRKMLEKIDFSIPNNTSSKYYINAIETMIEKGCKVSFEKNRVYVEDEKVEILNGIKDIECFVGAGYKVGLMFKIHMLQKETGVEIEDIIEVGSVKKDILSEREQLSFSYQNEFYYYDYLREYELDGTCVYHTIRDLVQKLKSSAKLYDKGILISLFNIKENERKSIILLGNYVGDKRKNASIEIKKGRIFDKINSPEGKEVPYKPYPFSNSEFEKILLQV